MGGGNKMKKKSKIALLASVILPVIAASIILIKAASAENIANIQLIVFYACLVGLAIVSVGVTYFTKIKKNNLEKQLQEDFYQGYDVIKEYIMNAQLDTATKKEIKEDVLDLLITAQNNGKSFDETVGEAQKFSLDILQQYGKTTKYNIEHFVESWIFMIGFTLGVKVLLWLEDTNRDFFDIHITLPLIVFFAILSFILVPYLKIHPISQNPKSIFLPIGLGVICVGILELSRRFLYDYQWIRTFLDEEIILVSTPTVLTIICIIFISLFFIKQYLKKTRKI